MTEEEFNSLADGSWKYEIEHLRLRVADLESQYDLVTAELRGKLAACEKREPTCNPHPDAPHGFCRDASHSAGRYVCECESWEPEE